ncbi:MAG TPA: hypothetical protein VFU63_09865 [Ktedonobacterales bacterium]|nr:hypothetical protein [Ktedonobacterales bacterium]
MARAFSMKAAAEQLEKLPAMLTHEGDAPVAAILRRGQPVLAVLPWDLYVGLLQTLVDLPEDVASTQIDGIRALLADATGTLTAETSGGDSQKAPSSRRPLHLRRPSHNG